MGRLRSIFLVVSISCLFAWTVQSEQILLSRKGGVYHVPVEINGVMKLDFILDTGAAEITIPADVALTLIRTGTLSEDDFLPGKNYVLADGSMVRSPRFTLRSVKIGNQIFYNIPASISDVEGHLLLGQSLLERVGSYTLDSDQQVLVLGAMPQRMEFPQTGTTSPQETLAQIGGVTLDLTSPEAAVEGFFYSITMQKFSASWGSISNYSKNRIVQMVAKEGNFSPEEIRKLFDENHVAVQTGFWQTFRETSKIHTLTPMASYRPVSRELGIAVVEVRVGDRQLNFKVYQEGQDWKVGLIESLEEFRSLSGNQ